MNGRNPNRTKPEPKSRTYTEAQKEAVAAALIKVAADMGISLGMAPRPTAAPVSEHSCNYCGAVKRQGRSGLYCHDCFVATKKERGEWREGGSR